MNESKEVITSVTDEVTRDKLVTWFCQTHPIPVRRMKEVNHFPDDRVDHPFHGEGSVWTHVMMVMTHIMCDANLTIYQKNILLLVALFHDLGKPAAFRIKVDTKRNIEKHSFDGHEGVSVFKALDYWGSLEKEFNFYANSDVKLLVLELIGRHGTNIIQDDHDIEFLQKRFRVADKEGAIRNIDENIFAQYPKVKLAKRGTDKDNKKLVILTGLQGSGKTTYARELDKDGYYILSRDDEILTFCEAYDEINDYGQAWEYLYSDENRLKSFDEYFDRLIIDVSKYQDKVVVDMMMLTVSQRRKMLNVFSNFEKRSVVFLTSLSELIKINEKRGKVSTQKLKDSVRKFIWPLKEEGFVDVKYIIR